MAKTSVTSVIVCLAAILAMGAVVLGQEAPDYTMYETLYLKVHSGKAADFAEKVTAHNRKFHAEGPYTARVWRVVNGERTGEMVWVMGPCTFTDLDQRPSGDPHDSDWQKVTSTADGTLNEYWRLAPELSYALDDEVPKIIRVRFFNISRGEDYRFRQMIRNLNEVREKKQHPGRVSLYRNRFWTASGREWAEVRAYDKWADLDRPGQMSKDYEEVHGEGSWRLLIEELEDVVESAESEYRELVPALGGPSESSDN